MVACTARRRKHHSRGRLQGNRTWKSPDLRRGACAIRARSILGPACRNPPEDMLDQFVACFEGLEDPRTGNAGLHDFHELLVIALCTVLSGGQGATHMEAFAVAKESFLRGFLAQCARNSM